jgi:hypothetical protein
MSERDPQMQEYYLRLALDLTKWGYRGIIPLPEIPTIIPYYIYINKNVFWI